MALIQKTVSNALVAANQANSRESTGPQSELGKRHSSQNAGRHLVYARVSSASMKELGENPADFDELGDSLRRVFAPRDKFEQMLVDDMAELRWRRRRLLRAEAGMIASKKRKFELDHEWELANAGKVAGERWQLEVTQQCALITRVDGTGKYSRILGALKGLRDLVNTKGFVESGYDIIVWVYGKTPAVTADGYPLLKVFTKLYTKQEAEDLTAQDSDRQAFLLHLETEIMHFEKLFRLTTERVKPLTEPMKDAQLLPRQKDLEKIVRYEAALERQFERKLQQLVAWRREKGEGGEKEAPQPREGGHDEAM